MDITVGGSDFTVAVTSLLLYRECEILSEVSLFIR